jgi:predicted DCC family thiol-disulfide oxidoreductase YuxK
MDAPAVPPVAANVVLVDGMCVICNRIVAFILDHDPQGLFYFAHLQGPLAQQALSRHGRDPHDIDGVYLLAEVGTPSERLLADGAAGREIWPRLFKAAIVLRWIPLPVLNFFYRAFARNRYRLFGKYDACRVPTLDERGRFLEG